MAKAQRLHQNNSPIRQESARGCCRFPGDPRRVAPQIFQTIKSALVAMEDVDHDFEIIEHDPLARRKTVDRGRAPAVIFF